MEIRAKNVTEYVAKSTGRMVVLLAAATLQAGKDQPLRCYKRGQRAFYTLEGFGPRPGEIYDYERSSPVKFTERQVDKAVESGLLARDGDDVFLSRAGASLAAPCIAVWGPIIDDYFGGQGYNIDWRDWCVVRDG